VLDLLHQGRSNLAVMNHYRTQELDLTIDEIQRIREQAGLDDTSPKSVFKSVSRVGGESGYEPRSPRSPNMQRRPVIASKAKSGGLVCSDKNSFDDRELTLGPVLKRERSLVASSSARGTSELLVMLSRHFGGLWGTLIGMGIYFLALYCGFMLVTHCFFIALAWIFSHKIAAFFLVVFLSYLYLVVIAGEPWHLSEATRDSIASNASDMALAVLRLVGLAITQLRCAINGTTEDAGGAAHSTQQVDGAASSREHGGGAAREKALER
jgi:hypothetical protein